MLGNLPLPRDKQHQSHASSTTAPAQPTRPTRPKPKSRSRTQWEKDASSFGANVFVVNDRDVHHSEDDVVSGDIRVLRELKEYVIDTHISNSWVPHRRLDEGAWHRVQTRTTSQIVSSVPNAERSRIGEFHTTITLQLRYNYTTTLRGRVSVS